MIKQTVVFVSNFKGTLKLVDGSGQIDSPSLS